MTYGNDSGIGSLWPRAFRPRPATKTKTPGGARLIEPLLSPGGPLDRFRPTSGSVQLEPNLPKYEDAGRMNECQANIFYAGMVVDHALSRAMLGVFTRVRAPAGQVPRWLTRPLGAQR